MMKKKIIPKFRNAGEERKFWSKNDSSSYIDWSKAKRISFPKLKPSVKSISLRLPKAMLDNLKTLANKKDIPYQSLMKMFLSDKIREEFTR